MSKYTESAKIMAKAMKEHDLSPEDIERLLSVPRETVEENVTADADVVLDVSEDLDKSLDRVRTEPRQEQSRERMGDRVPMAGNQLKLEVLNKDPNYYYNWFKMVGNRVQLAMRAGFVPVLQNENSERGEGVYNPDNPAEPDQWVTYVVNRRTPQPEHAVLMKQPLRFHQEDKAYKARRIKEREQGIRSHSKEDGSPDPNAYGDLSIETEFIR